MATPVLFGNISSDKALDLARKTSVRVATTAALPTVTAAGSGIGKTLTASALGVLTIDGTATVLNDRILVQNQVTGADNGYYKVTTEGTAGVAFVLTRATDFDQVASSEVAIGAETYVEEGTTNGQQYFSLTNTGTITLETTALTYIQTSGTGQITAGAGLTKTGNTINAIAGTGITVNADDIQISATYAGQTSIVTLGTITTGTWTGTDVAVADGGTGSSTASGARTNLGLIIGTDVQAYDATLLSIAALGTAADKVAYTTALDTWAETALTAFGRSLIDDATATAARTTLGLGTFAVENIAAVPTLTFADAANIATGTTTGTKFGTATTQKIGFFGVTPVVQSAAYTASNVTTDRSYDANATTIDELGDIMGTLIQDLKLVGIIG